MRDTIAAIASGITASGIGIVRISGPGAFRVLEKIFRFANPNKKVSTQKANTIHYGFIYDGDEKIDEVLVMLMKAPHTYTAEDTVEIDCHGGPYVMQQILSVALRSGARMAEPGEFTKRAFLNGRIDLSRAEAVMALISAEGGRAARAAIRQLEGGVSGFIKQAQEELIGLLSGAAAAIDYPEEITMEEAAADLEAGARRLGDKLDAACDERGARIAEQGLEAVLCGRPNVGKSSLLNALARQERAIVTDIPGTTRDIIRADVLIDGLRVHFADTAGLRDEGADVIERIGVNRARQAIAGADVVIVVLNAAEALTDEDRQLLEETKNAPRIVVLNQCDRVMVLNPANFDRPLLLSAKTGQGLNDLEQRVASFGAGAGESALTHQRHIRLAREAAQALHRAADACANGAPVDLAVIDLQDALAALGRVTGDQVDEKLIDDIFSRFCVGK